MIVVGVDVGAQRKGFHAVALRDLGVAAVEHFTNAAQVLRWCQELNADVVAVDSPCAWSLSGKSRRAERELAIGSTTIQCFKTPTREHALANKAEKPSGMCFYDWVFNGETIYEELNLHYRLFDGRHSSDRIMLETFPNAVVCALRQKVVPAKPKARVRRQVLDECGVDSRVLKNIDFVDAALCALTACAFQRNRFDFFGEASEGLIVVPKPIF